MDIYDRSWQNGKDQTWRKAILLAKVHVCKLCLVYYTLSVEKANLLASVQLEILCSLDYNPIQGEAFQWIYDGYGIGQTWVRFILLSKAYVCMSRVLHIKREKNNLLARVQLEIVCSVDYQFQMHLVDIYDRSLQNGIDQTWRTKQFYWKRYMFANCVSGNFSFRLEKLIYLQE